MESEEKIKLTAKVFISQPMNGKTDEDIFYEKEQAIINVKKKISENFEDVEILDSYIHDAPADANGLWYLGKSIEILSKADYIYMCKNWEGYRGCVLERAAALSYGITVIYETN